MATFNDLQFVDLSKTIFKYLSFHDLLQCRLVNKQFRKAVDSFKTRELVVGELEYRSFDEWFHTKELLYYKDSSISWKMFNKLIPKFRLDQSLKRLKILNDDKMIYHVPFQSTLNSFKLLEHLDLCMEYVPQDLKRIQLANLKILWIPHFEVVLDCPKLKVLRCYVFSGLKLIYPNTIEYLKLALYRNESVDELSNLNHLNIDDITWLQDVNMNVIFKAKRLRTLSFGYFQSDEQILEFFKLKEKLKRSDLKFFIRGIEIVNVNKWIELKSLSFLTNTIEHFKFRINNYNLLKDNESIHWAQIDYNYLIKKKWNSIYIMPKSFFTSFSFCPSIHVTSKIEDQELFESFILNFKYLNGLTLINAEVSQEILNLLPSSFIYLNSLNITSTKEEEIIDLEFICRFDKLEEISLDMNDSKAIHHFDLALKAFKQPALFSFSFKFAGNSIVINQTIPTGKGNYEITRTKKDSSEEIKRNPLNLKELTTYLNELKLEILNEKSSN